LAKLEAARNAEKARARLLQHSSDSNLHQQQQQQGSQSFHNFGRAAGDAYGQGYGWTDDYNNNANNNQSGSGSGGSGEEGKGVSLAPYICKQTLIQISCDAVAIAPVWA
jgi:hypothetical protein